MSTLHRSIVRAHTIRQSTIIMSVVAFFSPYRTELKSLVIFLDSVFLMASARARALSKKDPIIELAVRDKKDPDPTEVLRDTVTFG